MYVYIKAKTIRKIRSFDRPVFDSQYSNHMPSTIAKMFILQREIIRLKALRYDEMSLLFRKNYFSSMKNNVNFEFAKNLTFVVWSRNSTIKNFVEARSQW